MPDIYAAFTDEALIDRLRDGDAQITDYIMNKYKNLVRKKAKSMYILGADNDDLICQFLHFCRPVYLAADVQCGAGIAQGKTCTAQYIYFAVCRYDRGGG